MKTFKPRRLAILLLLALCCLPLAHLPMPIHAQPSITIEPVNCFAPLSQYFPDAECVYVSVPKFHAQPDGERIKLAVAKIPSTSETPAADPLVMLQGGPGGSGIALFGTLLAVTPLGELRQDREIILLEQRGTLNTQPSLACEAFNTLVLATLNTNLDEATTLQQTEAAFTACKADHEANGINLAAFNSYENAADIPYVLLDALGYESYNFYGVSYGTLLGQHLMVTAPRGLRSLILDANVPRQTNFLPEIPLNGWRAMQRLFAACAADATCKAANPDLEATFLKTVDDLNNAPATITLTNSADGKQYPTQLTGSLFVRLLHGMLYQTGLLPSIPSYLTASANGDHTWAERIGSLLFLDFSISYGMYFSVLCAEDSDYTKDDIQREGVPQSVATSLARSPAGVLAVCALWDVPQLPAEVDDPVVSAIPAFVINGDFDPITPPAFAKTVAQSLSNAFYVEYPGVGHGALLGGVCPVQMARAFLNDPTQAPDAACVATMGLRFPQSTAAIELEPITIRNFSALAPKGWQNPQPGTYVDGTSAVLIQSAPGDDADALLRAALGALLPPEPSTTIKTERLEWLLYEAEADGLRAYIAATAQNGTVYLVIVQGTPADAEALFENVLMPILSAFTIN
jgi:pimeloyl-ACP methyl ester carboxylesterase